MPGVPTRAELKKQRQQARERFLRARQAEKGFARQLRHVARNVGHIVNTMAPKGKVSDLSSLEEALAKYADMLKPWAKSVVERTLAEIGRRDENAWAQLAESMGKEMREEVRRSPVGMTLKGLMAEQVALITSLPLEAAQRVHKLALEGLSTGARAAEVAKEIERSGEVTKSRAMLIARTETARAASAMTQARALHVGSEGYIWRTSKDSDVRAEHRALEGKFIRWSDPPVAGSSGERAHAGMIYNCRCYPEPVLRD